MKLQMDPVWCRLLDISVSNLDRKEWIKLQHQEEEAQVHLMEVEVSETAQPLLVDKEHEDQLPLFQEIKPPIWLEPINK